MSSFRVYFYLYNFVPNDSCSDKLHTLLAFHTSQVGFCHVELWDVLCRCSPILFFSALSGGVAIWVDISVDGELS